jgi:acyl dehydratase
MALKVDILGMSHAYPDYFEVGRDKIREFADAVKADDPASHDQAAAAELGYDGLVAPLTFVSVMALVVQKDFFRVVDVGMETMQIVQVDQKFVYHLPVKAGDKIWCNFEVISVKEAFGADIVVTKNTCTNENGEVVIEAYTTLMGHEGEDGVKIDFM